MKTLTEQLTQYATYHRDRRNIITHFVGIPMIVASMCILLSRPALSPDLLWLTPGAVIAALVTAYYLRLDVRYGVVLGAYLWGCLAVAQSLAPLPTGTWFAIGAGLFFIGWVIQFIGHYFEGRKPAFVDDIIGLLIGPLFIAAEAGFLMGLRKDVEAEVNARAGAPR
ncbi:MAG TPA: Mpo1-like protein [Aquabacterium sp.]|uniref:Mpo1 family 2-hydroxy fatty acid dioxygenase n=1 Tax=Aquabacterium sp. TaxID=1872578 RepID=UPI002E2ED456|nr:Mpo1-like protein [Aquabacterium sp.]HEX5356043.1 Mpo1-like protein [Aquabacterium sp.]